MLAEFGRSLSGYLLEYDAEIGRRHESALRAYLLYAQRSVHYHIFRAVHSLYRYEFGNRPSHHRAEQMVQRRLRAHTVDRHVRDRNFVRQVFRDVVYRQIDYPVAVGALGRGVERRYQRIFNVVFGEHRQKFGEHRYPQLELLPRLGQHNGRLVVTCAQIPAVEAPARLEPRKAVRKPLFVAAESSGEQRADDDSVVAYRVDVFANAAPYVNTFILILTGKF